MSIAEMENSIASEMDTSPLTPEGETHRVQLDAIRAIAVLMVLFQHYFPETENWLEVGTIGVRVFFVLSGFLITGILLRGRRDAEGEGNPQGRVLRNFYVRRFLRIFPLYYAVLLATELLRFPPVRASFWWHAGYLSNFFLFRVGGAFDSVTHLWSLSVEEQFYLVWPWLILYLPRRWIMPTVLSAISIAPLFRAAILFSGRNAWQASILAPACLDTLGLGALLAILSQPEYRAIKNWALRTSFWIGIPLFLVTAIGGFFFPSDWWALSLGFSIGLWSMTLIDRAYTGFNGKIGAVLSFRPLTYLGLISYGIYIIHMFVGGIARRTLMAIGFHTPSETARAICMTLFTIVLASASWKFFEKPINRLKKRFPYK
jgi:peptidoglycan/LPS O-acetylase OafA/YrhL